jgi:type IV pilus assembly protein PilA
MFQMLKKKLKDQKGFTLIELLAVIVILGILAAIAIPSILGIISNTKNDAHVANAKQMVSSAQMAIASDSKLQSDAHILTMGYLVDQGYLEKVEDPSGTGYEDGGKILSVAAADTYSYVSIDEGKVIGVHLINNEIKIDEKGTAHVGEKGVTGYVAAIPLSIKSIDRSSVSAK